MGDCNCTLYQRGLGFLRQAGCAMRAITTPFPKRSKYQIKNGRKKSSFSQQGLKLYSKSNIKRCCKLGQRPVNQIAAAYSFIAI
jgi:hypothetical protein